MKEIENKILHEPITIYEEYLLNGLTSDVIEKAKKIYDGYDTATPLINKEVSKELEGLFPVAYPNSGSGDKKPTQEEAKEILSKLKKLKEELEK